MRLVVFGWGNESRGDDGLGPALLRRVAQAWPAAVCIEDYQLQIEHALDLDGADLALFLDAGKDTPAPFSFSAVEPCEGMAHTSHALSPRQVLEVFRKVRGHAPPPAFQLCVRGERFELGEDLSDEARGRLEAAWRFLQALTPANEGDWRKRAR